MISATIPNNSLVAGYLVSAICFIVALKALSSPRRARYGKPMDAVWFALLDPPRALAARRYSADGTLVFDVQGTRLLLEVRDGQAECSATSREPDLALSVHALAACHLGGHRFSALAEARMVEQRSAGALARAEGMFLAERQPWCSAEF